MPTPLRALATAAVLAFAGGATARPHPPAARHATRTAGAERRHRGHLGPSLARARALLAAVKRDPAKRRYRHHWERAIRALLRAARGADRAPALLEAARARYGLYRLSAVEADREKALRLAGRASRAGSREAARLAAAIRREAGDEPAAKVASEVRRAAPSRAAPGAPAPPGDDEEESPDPLL